VARVFVAAWLSLMPSLLAAVGAGASMAPFRTVIGPVAPAIAGLQMTGAPGGCDLFLLNQTGQDVLLVDDSSPAQALRFPSVPKSATPPPAALVHLLGNGKWKCSVLPGVTEDQEWSQVPVTVLTWTLRGSAGAQQFRAPVQTVYDPELDPNAAMLGYVRIGATALALGGLVFGLPYLLMRRRQILSE